MHGESWPGSKMKLLWKLNVLPSLHCRILLSNWLVGYEVEKKLQLNRQDRGVHVSADWDTCAFPFPGKFFCLNVPRLLFDMEGLCVYSDRLARSKGEKVPKTLPGPWRSSSIRQNHVNIPFVIITCLLPPQRGSSSLHPLSAKMFSDNIGENPKSKTSFFDTRQMSVLFGIK